MPAEVSLYRPAGDRNRTAGESDPIRTPRAALVSGVWLSASDGMTGGEDSYRVLASWRSR